MSSEERNIFEYILIIIIIIAACIVSHWSGRCEERRAIATKLCNKQQYDFCKIEKNINYTFKELE